MKQITFYGKINREGKIIFSAPRGLDVFIKDNPGSTLIINVTVTSDGKTVFQEVYFRNVVLKYLQEGFRKTGTSMNLQETNEFMKQLCPATNNKKWHESGCWIDDIVTDEDITKLQMTELIDHSVRYCAENFQTIVPDPEPR